MIQLTKFLNKDTFLYDYLQAAKDRDTDVLGDFWCGVFILNSLIQDKVLQINSKTSYNLQQLIIFLANNNEFYTKLSQDVQNFCTLLQTNCEIINEMQRSFDSSQKMILNFYNLADLEVKDLNYIRNKYIYRKELKNGSYKTYSISGVFCSNTSDYFTILGLPTEKCCGLLSITLPIYCNSPKFRGIRETTGTTRLQQSCTDVLQYRATIETFGLSSDGLRQYNKYVTNRTRKTGFYGQLLENLKDNYCLKLATVLAFNDLRNFVEKEDVENSIKIINATLDLAFEQYNLEFNEDPLHSSIEKSLIKIKKFLIQAGLNGMQHRSLYMKVHHDISNDTFRYLMNLLHELNLVEKLKVSHNSFIYRACDTLEGFNVKEVLNQVKEI